MKLADIKEKKESKQKITVLTCYDYSMAALVDSLGIDILLVGDSLGMVVLGYESTIPVTMEEMLHHARAVRRGAKNALVIGDMPFMTYQVSVKETIKNGGRFMKEAGCDAVKLEGGMEVADKIVALVKAGIPVMGHVGLTPQTASSLGGYKVQGKNVESAQKIIEDAMAVESAGAFAIILECIPTELASLITQNISIPTIGIGAGPHCDGQVLVIHDLLGIFERFTPSFVKQYANLAKTIKEAVTSYIEDVKDQNFPDDSHCFHADTQIMEKIKWGK